MVEIVCKDCETPLPEGALLCPACSGRRFVLTTPLGQKVTYVRVMSEPEANPWRPRD